MYGPVKTWCCPYVDCLPLSNFDAYSFGTGTVHGSASAWPAAPVGTENLSTRVLASGVVMPEISFALPLLNASRPARVPRYALT